MLQWVCNFSFDDVTRLQAAAGQWQDASGDTSEPSVPASRSVTILEGMYSCYHEMDFMNKVEESTMSHARQERLR